MPSLMATQNSPGRMDNRMPHGSRRNAGGPGIGDIADWVRESGRAWEFGPDLLAARGRVHTPSPRQGLYEPQAAAGPIVRARLLRNRKAGGVVENRHPHNMIVHAHLQSHGRTPGGDRVGDQFADAEQGVIEQSAGVRRVAELAPQALGGPTPSP